ncbi:MAG: hypothetical protein HC934_07720 [Acaryochloridaceae cyanobacterium SU_2_1]|nr:hypothetical protein [Acaryochloridaceae cyanobacterium SU_2_1]
MYCQQAIVRWLTSLMLMVLALMIWIQQPVFALKDLGHESQDTDLVEVSPPLVIQQLRASLTTYQPQVKILSPAADQLLSDDRVSVRFQVKDLPIFKDAKWGLGPHLEVLLDNQPSQALYDLSQPLELTGLAPGTHTLRAFATRPWGESFKNAEAYAQVTFHVFTPNQDNHPDPAQPLLAYGYPQGTYSTEPILLDFYLRQMSTPQVLGQDLGSALPDNIRVQVTVNGSRFTINTWQPLYLKGFKPGKNWVRLTLTDQRGQPIENAFNDSIRVVQLSPDSQDPLAKLLKGELTLTEVGGIVDPNYVPPASLPLQDPSIGSSATHTVPPQELQPLLSDPIPPLNQAIFEPSPTVPSPETSALQTPVSSQQFNPEPSSQADSPQQTPDTEVNADKAMPPCSNIQNQNSGLSLILLPGKKTPCRQQQAT